jgi:hypothetical protein
VILGYQTLNLGQKSNNAIKQDLLASNDDFKNTAYSLLTSSSLKQI